MDWSFFPFVFLIPITAIIGAFAYIIVHTIMRSRVRELEVRERIALIERGLVPPPEVDPRGFEKAMNGYEQVRGRLDRYHGDRSGRSRRAGVTMLAVGFGLMLLIGVAGDDPHSAIGVGGFIAIFGLAFLINSFFERRDAGRRDVASAPGPVASEKPADPSSH